MDTSLIIIIGAGVLLVAVIVFFIIIMRKRIKKNKAIKETIPAEILADFNEAERRLKESHGEINPIQILWDITKEKSAALQLKGSQTKPIFQAGGIKKLNQYQQDPINIIKKEVIVNGREKNDAGVARISTNANPASSYGGPRVAKRSFRFKKSKPAAVAGELHPFPEEYRSVPSFDSAEPGRQYPSTEGIGNNNAELGGDAGRTDVRGRRRRKFFRRGKLK